MRFAKLMLAMATLLAPALWAHADLAVNDAPYSPIVARNIFGLLPIPTNNPAALDGISFNAAGGIPACPMLFSIADHHSFKRMSRDEEPT